MGTNYYDEFQRDRAEASQTPVPYRDEVFVHAGDLFLKCRRCGRSARRGRSFCFGRKKAFVCLACWQGCSEYYS